LVTGATDGHLAFWSLSDRSRKLACVALRSLHQSSIKAIGVTGITDNSWLIASGGDDNALGLTIFEVNDDTLEHQTSSLVIPSAHAAAINALTVVRTCGVGNTHASIKLHVITASNDQVVKVWGVTVDSRKPGVKGVNVKRINRHCSTVADIASISVLNEDQEQKQDGILRVLVAGVGTEMWLRKMGD
jgi:hypothetical protein